MKKILLRIFNWLFTLALLGGLAYFFRAQLFDFKNRFYQRFLPCQTPITYSLGKFDQHFGLSQKQFLAVIADAERIWEKPTNLNLFEYSPSGTLKINLIYDYRQDATLKLRQLGIVVKDDQATYDKLQANYTSLEQSIVTSKKNLDAQTAELDQRTASYKTEVDNLNRRGGANPAEADKIHAEEAALNKLIATYNAAQNNYNNKIDELNALADTLNRLAKTLNISAKNYNTIGAARGSEFEEGDYVSSAAGQEINIYQYDNTRKLMRVLAHELGHALGLEHVSSTKAIMYYLNNGINEQVAPADLSEIKQHCGLK